VRPPKYPAAVPAGIVRKPFASRKVWRFATLDPEAPTWRFFAIGANDGIVVVAVSWFESALGTIATGVTAAAAEADSASQRFVTPFQT
jgi:hypothetical protein